MPNLEAGCVACGTFNDGDLLINGVSIGPVVVLADDADNALRDAINEIEGIEATLDENKNLFLNATSQIEISGFDPTGHGVANFASGVYE